MVNVKEENMHGQKETKAAGVGGEEQKKKKTGYTDDDHDLPHGEGARKGEFLSVCFFFVLSMVNIIECIYENKWKTFPCVPSRKLKGTGALRCGLEKYKSLYFPQYITVTH